MHPLASLSIDERINALLYSGDAALKRYPKPYRQRAQFAYDEALSLLLVKFSQLANASCSLKDRHQIRETLIRQLFLKQKISSISAFRAQDIDMQMIALSQIIDGLGLSVLDKTILKSAMSEYYSPRPEHTESFSIDDEVLLSYIEFISTVLAKTVPGSPERLWQLIDAAQKNPDFPSIIDLSKLKADRDFEYTKGLLNDLGRKLFNIDAEKITSSLGDPIALLMLLPEMNQKLLERLFQKALATSCEKIILLLGSNRQSGAMDLAKMHQSKQKNGINHSWFAPSGFQVLRLIATTLNQKCQQAGVAPLFVADYTTMTDLHNGLERGEHAKACLAALNSYSDSQPSNASLYLHYADVAESLQASCPVVTKADVAKMHVAVTKGGQLTIISAIGDVDQIRQALVAKPEAIPSTLQVMLSEGVMLAQHARPLTQDVAFEHQAKYGHKVSVAAPGVAVDALPGKRMPTEIMPSTESVKQSTKITAIESHGKGCAKTAVIFRVEKTKGHSSQKDCSGGPAK